MSLGFVQWTQLSSLDWGWKTTPAATATVTRALTANKITLADLLLQAMAFLVLLFRIGLFLKQRFKFVGKII